MNACTRARSAVHRVALGIVFVFVVIAPVAAQDVAIDPSQNGSAGAGGMAPVIASEHADHEAPQQRARNSDATTGHVPPPPPQHPMQAMNARQMTDTMEMDDAATLAMLKLDRFERADTDDGIATAWKLSAWLGGDFDKLWLRSEGEHARGETTRADAEILWGHASAAFWDTQLGLRHDFGRGTDRTWAAFGVQGLAPYWLQIGATAYLGDGGRSAMRLEVDYDLSLTQRLILQPRFELNAYGRDDASARIGSGLSDAALGLRLRYEMRREFAPYVGVEHEHLFGRTADFARADRAGAGDTKWVVGLRVWY
jgi:copper resistance protein B